MVAGPRSRRLLEVALPLADWALVRGVRVAAGFPQRLPLTQQIPALVELFLEVTTAFLALLRRLAVAAQRPFLVDEGLDPVQDVVVSHRASMARRTVRRRGRAADNEARAR